MDPFDDVRIAAAYLCRFSVMDAGTLRHAIDVAEETMCRTGRADCADGYGRLQEISLIRGRDLFQEERNLEQSTVSSYQPLRDHINTLLEKLEADVNITVCDIRHAVKHGPVHGRFVALRQFTFLLHLVSDTNFRQIFNWTFVEA